ncbi:hypothetical protein [Rufibacter tibetensis]|uniref:Uncharacterized protein n=1 Tax=Rufibacter tibetensis TaxID=512763 RepID=A0A0P0C770_9BACT|nr:hypothetical protein [Rufibacter tibetensis]ALI99217.1 hypothetical protein DC20_09805 [Rufibacter tibetensis]
MKKHLLTVLLCAFGLSLSPLASAAPAAVHTEEALPFFKKKKGSMARYKQLKRNNGTYVKKRTNKKKSLF